MELDNSRTQSPWASFEPFDFRWYAITSSHRRQKAYSETKVVNYVNRKMRVPQFSAEAGWGSDPAGSSDPIDGLVTAALGLPELRADASKLDEQCSTPSKKVPIDTLMRQARKIDVELERWHSSLPLLWAPCKYPSKHLKRSDETSPAFVELQSSTRELTRLLVVVVGKSVEDESTWQPSELHAYDDVFIAYGLNTYRSFRIYVHQVLLNCAEYQMERATSSRSRTAARLQITRSEQVSQQMVNEICSSVVYLVHNDQIASEFGELYLVGALVCASSVGEIPAAQKSFLEHELLQIAFPQHVKQGKSLVMNASIAARMLKFRDAAPPSQLTSRPRMSLRS